MKILMKHIITFPNTFTENTFKNNNSRIEKDCEIGIDIHSRAEFPIDVLSNFYPTEFELDGVLIKSVEGFLQSLKFPDRNVQEKICQMDGLRAKGIGKKANKTRNYDFIHLYWNGKRINRESEEYQELLNRMYTARYKADENFRFALDYTENRILKHSIGGTDPKRTLLTGKEYTDRLMKLRDNNGEL